MFVAILLACTIGAPLWVHFVAHHGPDYQNISGYVHENGKQIPVVGLDGTPIGPGWRGPYLLGADPNGRDLFVRVLYGGRTSLLVGIASAILCVAIALVLALVAGTLGGASDALISRFLDLIWSFPVYLLAVALAATLEVGGLEIGPLHVSSTSIWLPIVIIAVVFVPYVARPIRGQVLSLRRQEFVEAAVAHGAGSLRVMLRRAASERRVVGADLLHADRREQHPDRGGAVVPRRRRAVAHPVLGQHHRAGVRADRDGTGADDRARASRSCSPPSR